MIIYLLIGTIWTMFLEFYVKPTVNGEEMNSLTRVFNIFLWPINLVLFIVGFIYGVGKKDDEE